MISHDGIMIHHNLALTVELSIIVSIVHMVLNIYGNIFDVIWRLIWTKTKTLFFLNLKERAFDSNKLIDPQNINKVMY